MCVKWKSSWAPGISAQHQTWSKRSNPLLIHLAVSKKKGKYNSSGTLSTRQESTCNSVGSTEAKSIWGTKLEPYLSSRLLSEIFLELPDKNDYPDYYMVIKKPVAFDTVEVRKMGWSAGAYFISLPNTPALFHRLNSLSTRPLMHSTKIWRPCSIMQWRTISWAPGSIKMHRLCW